MKILLLSTWGEPCGIAGYSAHLVAALERAGVMVDVHPIERAKLAHLTRAERSRHFDRFVARARASDVDVVHIQHEFGFFGETMPESLRTTSRMLSALHASGKPVFVTFHSLLSELRMRPPAAAPMATRRQRIVARAAWRFFIARHFLLGRRLRAVVHSPLARRLLQESGIPPSRIDVVPQGVTPQQPGLQREEARNALGYGESEFVVVLTGFVSQYKGPDIALGAWSILRKSGSPRCVLAIVGGPHPQAADAGMFAEVLRRTRRRDDIRVTGYVEADELARHLAAADLAIAPYRDVGLLSSASLATALGARLPVVASAIDVFRELADQHRCVDLVHPESPEALAFAIRRLAVDARAREQLAAHASAYAESHGWDSVAVLQCAAYRRALPAKALAGDDAAPVALTREAVYPQVASGVAPAAPVRDTDRVH